MTQTAAPHTPILPRCRAAESAAACETVKLPGECGLRPSKAFTACAVSALAMVFSVQQGEHGPLVVYKLAVPPSAAPVAAAPPAPPLPASVIIEEPAAPQKPRLSPLQPTVLGTVAMPAERAPQNAMQNAMPSAMPPGVPPAHAASFGGMPLQTSAAGGVPDSATVYRIVEELQDSGMMINAETGDPLTLKQVNDAIAWRRDTTEKLRRVPIAPRF